jgi:NitT/TauT family transport system permease protein
LHPLFRVTWCSKFSEKVRVLTLTDSPPTLPGVVSASDSIVIPHARRRSPLEFIGPIVVFFLVLGVWYGGPFLLPKYKRFLLPMPHRIVKDGFMRKVIRDAVLRATWLDITVAVVGLFLAIVIGMTIAIVMAQARWLEKSFWPYLIALQAVPILIVSPLIGAIMGYGYTPRVFVTIVITIFPIISNTLFGLNSVETSHHDLFTLHRVGRFRRLVKLQLPAASPAIFAGFRISAGLAVIGAIVGDVFFRAGEAGLGLEVDRYVSRINGAGTWACIIMAAALGLAFFGFFAVLNKLVVGRWHESSQNLADQNQKLKNRAYVLRRSIF